MGTNGGPRQAVDLFWLRVGTDSTLETDLWSLFPSQYLEWTIVYWGFRSNVEQQEAVGSEMDGLVKIVPNQRPRSIY